MNAYYVKSILRLRPQIIRCYCQTSTSFTYEQGRTSKNGNREYFYYVDHQGQVSNRHFINKNFVPLINFL